MLLQRSKLDALSAERPRLAPPRSIAFLGWGVLALLALVFPQKELVRRIAEEQQGSRLASEYMVNLLRTAPSNFEVRVLLAREQLREGDFAAARATLSPVTQGPEPTLRVEAGIVLWSGRRHLLDLLPAGDPRRAPLRAELGDELRRLIAESDDATPETTLIELARHAMRFGERGAALDVYRRLGRRPGALSRDWFGEAAAEALAQGEYREAAALHFVARHRAADLAGKRRAYLAGLRALQSGNLAGEAVDAGVRELGDLADDTEALYALVTLARAANRLGVAETYARRMLRLSLLDQWRRELAGAAGLARFRPVSGEATEAALRAPLPFDDRVFTLGYEVFLNARKLDDAVRVARSAVRQAPDNAAWHQRLAQAAEWAGQPVLALEHWQWLAQREGGPPAWEAVLRLAPGLFDWEALLAAQRRQLAADPRNEALLDAVVRTCEELGRPAEALALLEREHRARPRPALAERMARLAERMGDLPRAAEHWRQFLALRAPAPAQALAAATVLLLLDRQAEALAVLARAEPLAGADDADYLRLTASLAQEQRQPALAARSLRRLLAGTAGQPYDAAALVALLRQSAPREAAAVAAAAWRRHGAEGDLLTALGLYAAHNDWVDMEALLLAPAGASRQALERNPDFLALRARHAQQVGRPAAARRDLEAALRLAPADGERRQALLWALIDGGDAPALRRLLASVETEARRDPALHDALAAAYLALSLPRVALERYLTPRLAEHRADFLWLMNYADALEQNGESDRAWRLRQALWREQQPQRATAAAPDDAALAAVRRVARVRLAMSQQGGGAGLAALRELLRADRAAGQLSPGARELVLAWLQGAGEYDAARGYLWQRYATLTARPAWAEIALALQADERDSLGRLLDERGELLPRHDRVSAATRLGDRRLAQTLAFEAQEVQGDDEPLQLQLAEALLDHSHSLEVAAVARTPGPLRERERRLTVNLALAPDLRLSLDMASLRQALADELSLVGIPAADSWRSVRLAWRHDDGESRLLLGQRSEWRRYTSLELAHEQRLGSRLSVSGSVGLHLPATETSALRVAGMKDRVALGLAYRLSQRERVALAWSRDNYYTQGGNRAGEGRHLQLEVASALRLDSPDLEVAAFAEQHDFSRRDSFADAELAALAPPGTALDAGLLVPGSFRLYGYRLASNLRYRQQYSRAWRPIAALAWTRHSQVGPGYDALLGLAGSVFGADHLALTWQLAKGGSAAYSHAREISLTYRSHF